MPRHEIDADKFSKLPLVTQFDELNRAYESMLDHYCEPQFLQFAIHFEECRQRWSASEDYCAELQEKLTKCEAEKDALIVKLKMARKSISDEMEGRHRAEAECDRLNNQLGVVREMLYNDSDPNILSEEQHKKLDFLNATSIRSPRNRARYTMRLQPIDETGSFLSDCSDISFDETSEDLDSSAPRNRRGKRSHAAAQQRALVAAGMLNESASKRIKADEHETLHCMIDGPATLEVKKLDKSFNRPNPHQGRRRPSREHRRRSATTTATSETETGIDSDVPNFWPEAPVVRARAPTPVKKSMKQHNLHTKTCVVTKETCRPCGKRIQFGKKALKCSDCRLVAHVECEAKLREIPCQSRSSSTERSNDEKSTVADYLFSSTSPQIPPIIYHTVKEIERRGLDDTGIYRIPGSLREVRQLRSEFLRGSIPTLTNVTEIHPLCSLVKEFLRNCIKEPIITFALRPEFIRASRVNDEASIKAAINKLPTANRDSLAFLMMHFQRVVNNLHNSMGVEGLSKAISPSLVGYASSDPNLEELQMAPKEQEIVVTALLGVQNEFYYDIIQAAMRAGGVTSTPDSNHVPDSMLGPVYSPKNSKTTTPSSSSLAERAKKYLGTPFGKGKRKENYFSSPGVN